VDNHQGIISTSIDEVRASSSAFSSLINQYCEQLHIETGKPRPMICIIVINRFKPYFSENWMRNQIDEKYKNIQRSNSGKKAWIKTRMVRLKDNAVKADSALQNALEEGTTGD